MHISLVNGLPKNVFLKKKHDFVGFPLNKDALILWKNIKNDKNAPETVLEKCAKYFFSVCMETAGLHSPPTPKPVDKV